MYGSGSASGSFYLQAKKLRKTLISALKRLRNDFLSLKADINIISKTNSENKILFFVGILKITDEKSRIRMRIKMSRTRNTALVDQGLNSHIEPPRFFPTLTRKLATVCFKAKLGPKLWIQKVVPNKFCYYLIKTFIAYCGYHTKGLQNLLGS